MKSSELHAGRVSAATRNAADEAAGKTALAAGGSGPKSPPTYGKRGLGIPPHDNRGVGNPPLREEIEMLREAIAQVSRLAAGSDDLQGVSRALQAISQGADRLAHLLKQQGQEQGETVEQALHKALDELMQELGSHE